MGLKLIKYDFCKLTWPYPYLELMNYMRIIDGHVAKYSTIHILQYRPWEGRWRQ